MKLATEPWMEGLDIGHRVLLKMIAERLVDPYEITALGGMSLDDLNTKYANLLRYEPIVIPVGTAEQPCRWCQQPTYWVVSRYTKDYKEQVSIAGEDCRVPTADRAGEGFAHLSDCPRSIYRQPTR